MHEKSPSSFLVDMLLLPHWLIPVEPEGVVLTEHAVAVHAGRIIDILDQKTALKKYHAKEKRVLATHALIPGLINAHTHSPMVLFRGLADDLPLMEWLKAHIWVAEERWLNPDFIRAGCDLAFAEMIKSGTTCFNEHYFFPETIATAAHHAGLRGCIGLIIIDMPTPWAKTSDQYWEKIQAAYHTIDTLSHTSPPLLTMSIAPHAPYSVCDETFLKVKQFSDQHTLPIHLHTHETHQEVMNSLSQHGERPLTRLDNLGLLSSRFMGVHMVDINADDITRIQRTGAHAIHCPESNLKLASGFAPVYNLMSAGINVGLGTDGAASNNDLNMLGEMRTAALLAKAVSNNPTALNAATALRMATLNGARALGLAETTGSIVVGKAADLVAIDLQHLNTQPVYHPLSQIVYAAQAQQVSDVWVAGRCLLKERALTTLDETAILREATTWQARIAA